MGVSVVVRLETSPAAGSLSQFQVFLLSVTEQPAHVSRVMPSSKDETLLTQTINLDITK